MVQMNLFTKSISVTEVENKLWLPVGKGGGRDK